MLSRGGRHGSHPPHFAVAIAFIHLLTRREESEEVMREGIQFSQVHAVAAHEVGHAIQHAEKYTPLVVRSRLVPVAQLGSNLGPWLIIAGLIFNFTGLAGIGIALFGAAVLFQLVTLPVEFNASARAHVQLQTLGIATQGEVQGTKSVLNAAAMTYVAATATSVLYLLYYVSMFLGRRN